MVTLFPIVQFLSMTYGYGIAFLKRVLFKQKIESFEDDLKSRLGIPLYSILFKPIAEKLWGEPKNLDLKLSQGRVQTPSFREIILLLEKGCWINRGQISGELMVL